MKPEDLFAAAVMIEDKALHYASLADRANKPELAALHGAVSKQLRDRAELVRTWAYEAAHTGTVTPDMETGTAEFLQHAGCVR